jgi:hypothetical protein
MPLMDINDFVPATERNLRRALDVPEPESRYGGVEGRANSSQSSDYARGMAAPSANKVPDTVSEEVIALNKKAEWCLDRLERLLGLADTTLARDQSWRAAAESWR